MAQNLPRGTPARVLVLLTLLTGVVAVSAWRDALRREKDNWVRHPTALGDTGLLQPGQLPALLATGGRTVHLAAAQGSVLHRPDDRMFRVLTSSGPGESPLPFTLFTTRENLPGDADPKLYARTAPHQFRRLKASLEPIPDAQVPLSEDEGGKSPPVAPLGDLENPGPEPLPADGNKPPESEASRPPKAIPVDDDEEDFPR